MTEQEWLACTHPTPMLEFVRDKATDRKLRLFAVACCRRIWRVLTDERSRKAVEAAEQFADGLLGEREMWEAGWAAGAVAYSAGVTASAAAIVAVTKANEAAWKAAWAASRETDREVELTAQSHL